MRWIKKPPREDVLWFLIWPLEVKLGPKEESGMSTDHTFIIWLEFVRITSSDGYEYKFRVNTRDKNGFDYYGKYFDIFRMVIRRVKLTVFWSAASATTIFGALFISRAFFS